MSAPDVEGRVRAICVACPRSPRSSATATGIFRQKQFVMLWPHGHHGHHFPHLWCAAPVGAQEGLVTSAPNRFFRPPYVGARGWLGVASRRSGGLAQMERSARTRTAPWPRRAAGATRRPAAVTDGRDSGAEEVSKGTRFVEVRRQQPTIGAWSTRERSPTNEPERRLVSGRATRYRGVRAGRRSAR